MHLLIPFAAPLSDAGRAAAATLQLPYLQRLLGALQAGPRDDGDARSFSPPHERARARALGLQAADGELPWAALQAAADGIEVGAEAWGLLTPAHWHLGTDQVTLIAPESLVLDAAASMAFFAVLRPLFEAASGTQAGMRMHYGAPLRWYAAGPALTCLASASLDRVVGRNVDAWLGQAPQMQGLRRLQSEVQMLLYTHPLNDERLARGMLPLNSFWLSGCGAAPVVQGSDPTIDARLRASALAEDWPAWTRAWQTLDEGPLAAAWARVQQGLPLQLTLAGECGSASFATVARSRLQQLLGGWRARLRPVDVAAVLAGL